MAKSARGALLSNLTLDRNASISLTAQLLEYFRHAVLSGELRPSSRLPSSRVLAGEMGVARLTVVNVFEQLVAEGYFVSKIGAGTFVTSFGATDRVEKRLAHFKAPKQQQSGSREFSERGDSLIVTQDRSLPVLPQPFTPNMPAFDVFPSNLWAKLTSRHWRNRPAESLYYGKQGGDPTLKKVIADYLVDARAIHCDPEQVIIVAGSQQAISLCTYLLTDPGDKVWVEDPVPSKPSSIIEGMGADLVFVPTDSEGIIVSRGLEKAPDARMALVTPSRQYPLGVTLSLTRRLELLAWASERGGWIIEDDYDSEIRFSGRPLPAMKGLDQDDRVIYVGTFSKVLFPSIRLGYLVVPPDLIEAITWALELFARGVPSVKQTILAEFIERGHYTSHIRRMRQTYAERQEILARALHSELGGLLTVHKTNAGMNLLADLPDSISDIAVYHAAFAKGIIAYPLSYHYVETPSRNALILGFSHLIPDTIEPNVAILKRAIESL